MKTKNINDITTYEVGDILQDDLGTYKVQGICGEIVFISDFNYDYQINDYSSNLNSQLLKLTYNSP